MTLRALIVDDEPLAREKLRTLLGHEGDVEVVGECGDGLQAVASIERLAPDLVFLDVQMPEIDGFGVLEAIPRRRLPAIIFVTAYDRYALKAFEVHALDYLLKPFDRERFHGALDRARAELIGREGNGGAMGRRLLELLEQLHEERAYTSRFVVRESGRVYFVRVDEIEWIEAAGNYARIHVGPRDHLLRETMKMLEARLDPEKFLRIHRSMIVNVERIRQLEPSFHGEYEIVLASGARVTSSRGYSDRLKRLIGKSG
jgi:two-component system LytT family response regulator